MVMNRDHYTCQMCGAERGKPHHDDHGRITRLRIGQIYNFKSGSNDSSYLRTLCTMCYDGAVTLTFTNPELVELLSNIRRAPQNDQLDVLKWAIQKFPKEAQEILNATEL